MSYSIEPLTLSEIAAATGGEIVFGEKNTLVGAVSTDSRDCENAVFVAISGEKFNGNDFIPN
ncbi:MAG: UDP-N-acetylmuramoyl-tripeptide--D-alanyl-D-alanine ligase, partial [Ruminococcaceae bacterium]|nr:UDP-N-acetylmuramoyl-tripeptide--D-alanyl-D-alanine ligase [Oscillospiraceae bacterium]